MTAPITFINNIGKPVLNLIPVFTVLNDIRLFVTLETNLFSYLLFCTIRKNVFKAC